MKTRNQLQVRRSIGTFDTEQSYHAGSIPNSSAILAVTVLANIEDVLAAVRTAALLGRSLKAAILVNLPGKDTIHIESGENVSEASLLRTLDSIRGKLRKQGPSQAQVFALEATIAAASFLAPGTISMHIRGTDSVPKRPTVAR